MPVWHRSWRELATGNDLGHTKRHEIATSSGDSESRNLATNLDAGISPVPVWHRSWRELATGNDLGHTKRHEIVTSSGDSESRNLATNLDAEHRGNNNER